MPDKQTGTIRGFSFQAVDPVDGTEMAVLLPSRIIRWAHRQGKGALVELHESVSRVLIEPRGLFQGIRRDHEDESGHTDGWLCYSGDPDTRYDYRTGETIDRGLRVYMVYLNKEKVIYHVRWEKEDSIVPGLPADRDNRFGEQII